MAQDNKKKIQSSQASSKKISSKSVNDGKKYSSEVSKTKYPQKEKIINDEIIPEKPAVIWNFGPKKLYALIPLVITFFIFGYVWLIPKPDVMDPWFAAFNYINKSLDEKNETKRQQLIDTGGAMLRNVVKQYPNHARVRYLFGIYYSIIGNLDSAIIQHKEAIRMGSGALVNRVDLLSEQELARIDVIKSTQLLNQQKYNEARPLLWEAIKYNPNNSDANFYLGITYHTQGNLDSAMIYYNNALRQNPKNAADIICNMGQIFLNRNQLDQAKLYFTKAVELNPRNQNAINGLNMVNQRLQK